MWKYPFARPLYLSTSLNNSVFASESSSGFRRSISHFFMATRNTTEGAGAVRVFANGPGDLGSIPGRVIPKTQKMVLDASLLSTQHYKVRIKGKVEQSRKGVAPSPTHWCSSYRKVQEGVLCNTAFPVHL